MPYGAYLAFNAILAVILALIWISNKMGESAVTAVLCMAFGAVITIITLAKCGVDLR